MPAETDEPILEAVVPNWKLQAFRDGVLVAFLALGLMAGCGLTIAFLPFQVFITVVQR